MLYLKKNYEKNLKFLILNVDVRDFYFERRNFGNENKISRL